MFDAEDSDDDEQSMFPSMPINFVSREPFQALYQLDVLEHQVALADGLVAPLNTIKDGSTTDNKREGRLHDLYNDVHEHATAIADGRYLEVLRSASAQHLLSSVRFCQDISTEAAPLLQQRDSDAWMLRKAEQASAALVAACKVRQCAAQYILHGRVSQQENTNANVDGGEEEDEEDDDDWLQDVEKRERRCRATTVAMIGAAALNSFVQQNWTGPPLEIQHNQGPKVWLCSAMGENESDEYRADVSQQRRDVRLALEIDGDRAFYKCELPELLLLARCLLSMVATGGSGQSLENTAWNHRGGILCPPSGLNDTERASLRTSCAEVTTARWWAARSAVIHHRTLIFDVDGNISLKNEIEKHFNILRAKYANAVKDSETEGNVTIESRRLAAQVELEYV
jgi:hypothetical protein